MILRISFRLKYQMLYRFHGTFKMIKRMSDARNLISYQSVCQFDALKMIHSYQTLIIYFFFGRGDDYRIATILKGTPIQKER